MYEIIVLGATFAAAGIAHQLKEKCLVIESRGDGGYEFFGGQSFAATEELSVYPFLKECYTVFCCEVCSVKKEGEDFLCETHGVDGFFTYKAKRIIDTPATADMSLGKTYDMLIDSEEEPQFPNATCKKAKGKNRYVVKLSVPLYCGFSFARRKALELVKSFSDTQRLILLADEFSFITKEDCRKEENGIFYLPSCSYATPRLAFNGGEEMAK